MTHYGTWSPYTGSSSIILAVVLFIVTGVLIFLASRLHSPIAIKRPGKAFGVLLVVIWLLSAMTFLMAAGIYGLADKVQGIRFTGPMNPILPVTMTSAAIAFFVIVYLAQSRGFWMAVGSAIVYNRCADDLRASIRSDCDGANVSTHSSCSVYAALLFTSFSDRDLQFCDAHAIAFHEAVEIGRAHV